MDALSSLRSRYGRSGPPTTIWRPWSSSPIGIEFTARASMSPSLFLTVWRKPSAPR